MQSCRKSLQDMLHRKGGRRRCRASRMRDPAQEDGEGDLLDDVMEDPRKAAEEKWSGRTVHIGATGWKACLKEYGETER